MLSSRTHILILCLLLGLLTACDMPEAGPPIPTAIPAATATALPPSPTRVQPTPSPVPTVLSTDELQKALQEVVDLQRRAVEAGNQDMYMSQIDVGDRDWRLFQEGEFSANSYITERLSCVSDVQLGANGRTATARVGIDDCPGRYHISMFFRLVGERWLHSQPGLDEQGKRDTRKIGPFRVTYHEMDAASLEALERFAPAIYERVSGIMDTTDLDVEVDLVSRPTDMPRSAFTTIALYNPAIARMTMLSPFFWANGDGTEVQLDEQIEVTLTHEFAHHAVRTLALTRVPHWLNEGIAVYVSGENPTRYVREVQLLAGSGRLQPPEVLDDLLLDGETASVGYSQGYSFVKYMTDKEGNDILPALLRELRKTGDMDLALTKLTGQDLDAWWLAWARSIIE